VTPEPPKPEPSAVADGGAAMAGADAATAGTAQPDQPAQPAIVGAPAVEAKPPIAKTEKTPEKLSEKPADKPGKGEAKRKPKALAPPSGAIEVAPPPSEKPVAVAADKPAGEAKPAGETPAKEAPLPPTPESPAAPAIAPMLRIASVPAGARVLLDGVPAGTTPISIKDIDPNADHTVIVQKEGFENHERQFGPSSWTRTKSAAGSGLSCLRL